MLEPSLTMDLKTAMAYEFYMNNVDKVIETSDEQLRDLALLAECGFHLADIFCAVKEQHQTKVKLDLASMNKAIELIANKYEATESIANKDEEVFRVNSKLTFSYADDDLNFSFESQAVTTDEVMDHFVRFLLGVGYCRHSIQEAMREVVEEHDEYLKAESKLRAELPPELD